MAKYFPKLREQQTKATGSLENTKKDTFFKNLHLCISYSNGRKPKTKRKY